MGPVEACDGADLVPLGSPQQRFVLVALLLEPNRVVAVDRLVDMMWPEGAPASARNALQVYVSRLRRVLRPRCGAQTDSSRVEIQTVGAGYRIVVDPEAVDVHRFHALLEAARRARGEERAVSLLRRALELWSGPPLADLDSPWLRRHVCLPWEESWADAHEQLFTMELRRGNHHQVLPRLREFAARYPTRERLAAQLMAALYDMGQRAEALAAYRRVSEAFSSQLGIDPGPALDELHLAILRNDPVGVPAGR